MGRILASKNDHAFAVVRPHVHVNLSGNNVKLNFLFMVVESTVVLSTQHIFFKEWDNWCSVCVLQGRKLR
jgi:hypothetical protein